MKNFVFLFFLICAVALGQVTTGSISGFLLDPSHKPIAHATVSATDPEHSFTRQTHTDAAGFYRFEDLSPAVYQLSATPGNFEAVTTGNIQVDVNQRVRVDFNPPVAGQKQSITVDSVVQKLATESSELGTVLDRGRIEGLPLNRRDFLQLSLLTPGVLPPVQDSELSTRGAFAMHANGGREEFNNFLLDGIDNNDQDTNRYVLQPSVDAIQEFKIATNSYSAEYGRNGGGQVNVITRGGTNQFHGFLYDYLRNRVMDARNFFDGSQKAQYIRNQFGGGAGGPVLKDRMFFFANFDGLRERQGLSRLGTVPTAEERGGDLSALTATIVNPFTQKPFTGNRVPTGMIDPLSAKYLALFPMPNLPGIVGNYLAQPVLQNSQNQFNGRLDYRLTEVDQLTLRYSFGKKDLFEPFAEQSVDLPGFGDYLYDTGHNALVHYQRTLGPRTINSLRLGFNRAARQDFPQNYKTDVNSLWGVSYLPTRPIEFGFPAINVSGFGRVGDTTQLPIDRHTATYQVSEDLSMVRGAHGLKIGAEVRKLQLNGLVDVFPRGSISFSGALSGSGISDLLLGLPSFGIQSSAYNPQTFRTSSTNVYAQDDWKVRPNLTLNLGLRYEYNTPPTDPTNRMAIFDINSGKVVQVGTNGTTRSGIHPDWNNFAPRVGFAWSPAQKWVVRGGYGLYYDAGTVVVDSALYYNPPFFTISVFFPTQTLLHLNDPFPRSGGITPPASLSTLNPDNTTSYMQDWNLNVQRDLGSLGTVSLAYAGSKGTHLIRSRDLNQPAPGLGAVQSRRRYKPYANILFAETGGNSEYNALQFTYNRALSRGVSVLAAYTLGKSIDDTSAFLPTKPDTNFPQDSRNYRLERGVSSFDIHQRATIAAVYKIPGSNIWFRDFETSGILSAQTGQPFTPVLRFDNSNTGNTGGSGAGSDRPNLLRNPELSRRSPTQWFDTSAFAVPAPYTFGSAGRNILRGPGLFTIDLSLARRFPIHERASFLLEAQAFNLLNRANFDLPALFADQPTTFGRIFSAKAPRQIQMALRFTF